MDPYGVTLARFAIGIVFIASLAMGGQLHLSFVNRRLLLVRGLLGGAGTLIFYFAIIHLGLAKGTVISYAYPVFAAIGGALFMGEAMGPRRWMVCGLAFAGLYFTITTREGWTGGFGSYETLALLGAVMAGAVICVIRRLRTTDTSASIFTAQCAVGFWMVLIPANSQSMDLGLKGSALLLAIGLFAACGQLIMTYSYKHLPVASGSLLGMLSPVLNVLIGWGFFAEPMSLRNAAGMGMVLVSCALITLVPGPGPKRRDAPVQPPGTTQMLR